MLVLKPYMFALKPYMLVPKPYMLALKPYVPVLKPHMLALKPYMLVLKPHTLAIHACVEAIHAMQCGIQNFYFERKSTNQAGTRLEYLCWKDNEIGPRFVLVGFRSEVMLDLQGSLDAFVYNCQVMTGFGEDGTLRKTFAKDVFNDFTRCKWSHDRCLTHS